MAPPHDASRAFLKKIPGPPSYPFIGAIGYLNKHGGIGRRDLYVEALQQDYGWVSKIELPFASHPIIFHPDDIRLLYAADGKYPSKSIDGAPPLQTYLENRQILHKNLSSAELEDWRKLRIGLQKHILPPNVACSYLPLLNPISRDFSRVVQGHQDSIKNLLSRFSFEGVGSVLFGKRLGALTGDLEPEDAKFVEYTLKVFPELSNLMFSLPLWRFYETPALKRFSKHFDYLRERGRYHVMDLLKKMEKDPAMYSECFLARMMASKDMTEEQIILNVGGLLIAGVDTTSNTLHWLFLHLAQFQDAQEKLYQELNSVLKGGDYDDSLSSQLPYMKACFRESFRLDPVTLIMPRRPQREVTFSNGLTIPAGMQVYMGPFSLNHNPMYFDDPHSFVPERWLEEAKEKRAAEGKGLVDHPMLNITFSFGPRMCLGARFASVEMNSLISRVIQDYKIEVAPNQKPIGKICKLFVEPLNSPKLIFTPRK